MEEINISTFTATCLEVLRRVKRKGLPMLVTFRGEPVAEVRPPTVDRGQRGWLGSAREREETLAGIERLRLSGRHPEGACG